MHTQAYPLAHVYVHIHTYMGTHTKTHANVHTHTLTPHIHTPGTVGKHVLKKRMDKSGRGGQPWCAFLEFLSCPEGRKTLYPVQSHSHLRARSRPPRLPGWLWAKQDICEQHTAAGGPRARAPAFHQAKGKHTHSKTQSRTDSHSV